MPIPTLPLLGYTISLIVFTQSPIFPPVVSPGGVVGQVMAKLVCAKSVLEIISNESNLENAMGFYLNFFIF